MRLPVLALFIVVAAAGVTQLPAVAAGALLQPPRTLPGKRLPAGCVERDFEGTGVTLRGWHCSSATVRRATIVLLHGVADTREGMAGMVDRFTRSGLDVVAYDGRAHGRSTGEFCTYGYFEKHDVRRVVGALPSGPVLLMGTSLGAAVALQAAVDLPRLVGVIAAEAFADLRSIARDRVPWFVPEWMIGVAFRRAEAQAGFQVDAVSPLRAAAAIRAPVLLIHGKRDVSTPPAHSRRLLAALRAPKRLIVVRGAAHNQSLKDPIVWTEIEQWVKGLLPPAATVQ